MEIKLKNIGIVKDSAISLAGLTVITGKNDSGKTTVGKTLYALIDAVNNIQKKSKADKRYYIRHKLDEINDILIVFRFFRGFVFEGVDEIFSNYSFLKSFISGAYRRELTQIELEQYVHGLIDDLSIFDASILENNEEVVKYIESYMSVRLKQENVNIIDIFSIQKEQALSELNKLLLVLEKDPELMDYTRESINQTLRLEFANQIQPIKGQTEPSRIELLEDGTVCFQITIENNNIVNDGFPVFFSCPYKKVYFVDNPFILDNETKSLGRKIDIDETESLLNPNRIHSHNYKLERILKSDNLLSVFEQTILSESLKKVKVQIDNIIPGSFEFSSDGDFYVMDDKKLKFSNLATGSKMFSILKILLNKGELDNSTMLILDEPEAHLHPMWQNSFAEIIILLVKELNVNVLLTTHSPNFMLAIDANMRKYQIAQKSNFYQTETLENGFVKYHCVNDDIGNIYQDFMQYLSEVKMLRNQYINSVKE